MLCEPTRRQGTEGGSQDGDTRRKRGEPRPEVGVGAGERRFWGRGSWCSGNSGHYASPDALLAACCRLLGGHGKSPPRPHCLKHSVFGRIIDLVAGADHRVGLVIAGLLAGDEAGLSRCGGLYAGLDSLPNFGAVCLRLGGDLLRHLPPHVHDLEEVVDLAVQQLEVHIARLDALERSFAEGWADGRGGPRRQAQEHVVPDLPFVLEPGTSGEAGALKASLRQRDEGLEVALVQPGGNRAGRCPVQEVFDGAGHPFGPLPLSHQ